MQKIGLKSKKLLFYLLCSIISLFLYDFSFWLKSNSFSSTFEKNQLIITSVCKEKKNGSLPEHWCYDENGQANYIEQALVSPTTKVLRYNQKGFQKCLSGKTLVFIGDSRVRYQLLSLVDFLIYGKWMKCSDEVPLNKTDDHCFLLDHHDLKNHSWRDWYIKSTKALSSSSTLHLCDCFRPQKFDTMKTRENRFIHMKTNYGNITFIYLQSARDYVSLDRRFPPYSSFNRNKSKRCKVGFCKNDPKWLIFSGDVNTTLWNITPLFNPTHIIANIGWIDPYPLSCELNKFEKINPHIKTFYMTGLGSLLAEYNSNGCDEDVIHRGNMSKGVPESWFFDKAHVLGVLNREFNHKLIHMICPMV